MKRKQGSEGVLNSLFWGTFYELLFGIIIIATISVEVAKKHATFIEFGMVYFAIAAVYGLTLWLLWINTKKVIEDVRVKTK